LFTDEKFLALRQHRPARAPLPMPAMKDPDCTLDTREEVEAVVIAALQLRYPHFEITSATKLEDTVGGPDARAAFLPGWMIEATIDGGCRTRLGSDDYRPMKTVKDIVDKIWEDLKDKCDL
jgi:hypothetical protein